MRWFVPLLLVVGCYSPSYRDCEVTCASGQCPAGLRCDNGVCRLPGMTGACGAPMGDVPVDGSRDIPIEQLGEARLAAMCGYLFRCRAAESVATCMDVVRSLPFGLGPSRDYSSAAAAVAAGTALYHPDKVRECLEYYETETCDRAKAFSAGPLACSEIFSGTSDADAACAIPETCRSQNCVTTSCTNQCCTGTCAGDAPPSTKALDEPCTFRDRCTGGYCDTSNMSGAFCLALKTQGQACTSASQCADGLTCRSEETTGALTCQVPVENLGPCMSTQDCRYLADTCNAGACVTGGLEGTPCPMGNECQLYHSCTGGSCALPPVVGDPCTLNQGCRNSYCNGTSCVARLGDGEPCDPARGGADCESGYCGTDAGTSACKPRPICS